MARIFISHSNRDAAQAHDLLAWLHSIGFEQVFLDFEKNYGIPAGAKWEQVLYREIADADAIILVLTANWFASKWCFVEFAQARALGKAIFPVIETPQGERYVAPDIQSVDLISDRAGGLERLAAELTRIALDARQGFAWERTRPPFPGIFQFQEADAAIYFGRDDDIRGLIERLNARRVQGGNKVVILHAASGAGKSSLLRAGVLPRLKRDRQNWIVLPPFTPKAAPLRELGQAFAVAVGPAAPADLQDLLAQERPDYLTKLAADLRAASGANEASLLLSVDQGEQLFTAGTNSQPRKFWQLLRLMTSSDLPYVGLITARSDYLPHFQREAVSQIDEYSLKPMPVERIRDIIEGPARVAGLSVEPALITAVERDAPTEDVLPLLAFALRTLYDRFASSGRLTLEAYRSLGDVTLGLSPLVNAVRQRADEVLQQARPNHSELQSLKDAFVPAMVSIGDSGEYVGRPARLDALPAAARPLIDRLVEARLLIISGDDGAALVEVAHEALLRNWPLLRGWLDEEREFLVGKRRLEDDLSQWSTATAKDKPAALLQGLKLTKARSWLSTRGPQLSAAERAFIQASVNQFDLQVAEKLRFKRFLRAAGVLVACLLTVFAVYAVMQWRRANNALETAIATANQIVSDLGHDLRDRVGMPPDLVRMILQRAQDLQQALLDSGETSPEIQISAGRALNELVLVLLEQGEFRSGADVAAAGIIADRFLSIMQRLSPEQSGDNALRYLYSLGLHRVGDVQMAMGDFKEALNRFERAGEIRQALLRADPANDSWFAAVAANDLKIGDARNALGTSEDRMVAYTSYDRSLATRKQLARRNPTSSERKRDLALSYERQGSLVRSFGQWQEALGLLREALAIRVELAAIAPQSVRAQRDLAIAKDGVGAVHLALSATEDALQLFRDSLEIRQRLAFENPSSQSQRDLAVSFGLLGDVLAQKGELSEAISFYRRGLVIHERLFRGDPHNAVWRVAKIKTLLKLAEAGDSPRERLSSCHEIARQLEGQSTLAATERELLRTCEERLRGLPQ